MKRPNMARSVVEGLFWPAFTSPHSSHLLSLAHQMELSQWWSADTLRTFQLFQLEKLLNYADRNIPYWNSRFATIPELAEATALTDELWQRLPVLTRDQVQLAGAALRSPRLPSGHGDLFTARTSGSTGRPLTSWHTRASIQITQALRLRHYVAHRLPFSSKLADIRAVDIRPKSGWVPGDASGSGWVPGYPSGPFVQLDVRRPAAEQLDWLATEAPDLLLTHPSNLEILLEHSARTGQTIPGLKTVTTFGEVLLPRVRQACRQIWATSVVDVYSAVEVSILAAQCPEHEHYHVQSEGVLVEVVDEEGRRCGPGGVGRVVVTPLHNFAMPLIRYEIGDYAEVGDPCPCGRGLPVLRRILGRPRNMLLMPTGERVWPVHPDGLAEIGKIRQFRLVQVSVAEIRVDLALYEPLTQDEEEQVRSMIEHSLSPHFQVSLSVVDEVASSQAGKREDFVSEL